MGLYEPDWKLRADDKRDRHRILSINDWFDGRQPAYPPFRNVTFKLAEQAEIEGSKRRTRRLGETLSVVAKPPAKRVDD